MPDRDVDERVVLESENCLSGATESARVEVVKRSM